MDDDLRLVAVASLGEQLGEHPVLRRQTAGDRDAEQPGHRSAGSTTSSTDWSACTGGRPVADRIAVASRVLPFGGVTRVEVSPGVNVDNVAPKS